MTAVLHTHSQNYTFGRGELFVALLNASDVEQESRYFGNTPGLAISLESEDLDHISAEGGISEVDDSVTISVTRTGQIVVDDLSAENLALFIVGSATTHAQSGSGVTNEQAFASGLAVNRYAQLGRSVANPPGVRNVSSVTVTSYEHDNASARIDSTAYAVGDFYTSGGDLYVVTVAGTSAGSAPSFDTAAIGNTTADGTATVAFLDDETYTVTTDYLLDAAKGWIMPVSGGKVSEQLAALPSGSTLSWNVDYTPAAESRDRITSEQLGALNVALRYYADNPKGDNNDFFLPDVTLRPSGDLAWKSDGDWLSMTFDYTINKKDTSQAAVYIEGRAAA